MPLGLLFVAWEFAARLGIANDRIPALSSVLWTLATSIGDFAFVGRVFQSFANLSIGIFLAFCMAFPLALAAGLKSSIDSTFTPLIMLVGALPDLVLLPFLVALFGPGNSAVILMASIAAFFPIFFTVREGTKDIPRDLFHVATVFNSTKFDTLSKMVFPAISPQLFSGLRISYDFVWEVVLAVELIAHVSGVGTLIEASLAKGTVELALAAILALGTLSILVDRLIFGTLEGWVKKWMA